MWKTSIQKMKNRKRRNIVCAYSQITGKDKPTKALERYSVYISLATPSR